MPELEDRAACGLCAVGNTAIAPSSRKVVVTGTTTMINTFDPVRLEAFTRLLARPDPRSLPRRTHAYRWEGDPDRRVTRLPAIMMGWLQRRYLDTDVEAPVVCATRTPK